MGTRAGRAGAGGRRAGSARARGGARAARAGAGARRGGRAASGGGGRAGAQAGRATRLPAVPGTTILRARVAHTPRDPFLEDGALETFDDGAVAFAGGTIL